MAINPVASILSVWRAWRSEFLDAQADGDPWRDLRNDTSDKPNCVLDSEIVLTMLYPQCVVDGLTLKATEFEPRAAYASLTADGGGSPGPVLQRLAEALLAYFRRHSTPAENPEEAIPTFRCETYLDPPHDDNGEPLPLALEDADRTITVVDAFAFSLTVSLYAKYTASRLLRALQGANASLGQAEVWQEVIAYADKRLTAAMQGLLASFAFKAFDSKEAFSEATGWPWPGDSGDSERSALRAASRARLDDVASALRALGFRPPNDTAIAFECGWAWAPLADNEILGGGKASNQRTGATDEDAGDERAFRAAVLKSVEPLKYRSENAPYLYFTINALDSVEDLGWELIDRNEILTKDQLMLASRLKRLANLTREYWLAIAMAPSDGLGAGLWRLETLPFHTTDGVPSLYHNLYLARIVSTHDLLTDNDVERLISFASRLSEAGRITTRPVIDRRSQLKQSTHDPVLKELHHPGTRITLDGVEKTKKAGSARKSYCSYLLYDFSPQVLKLCGQLLEVAESPEMRSRLDRLIESVWNHLNSRRARNAAFEGLMWDDPGRLKDWTRAHGGLAPVEAPPRARGGQVVSWYITERVVEALASVARGERAELRPSPDVLRVASAIESEFLSALVHVRNRSPETASKVEAAMQRAQGHLYTRPALALGILMTVADDIEKAMRTEV